MGDYFVFWKFDSKDLQSSKSNKLQYMNCAILIEEEYKDGYWICHK